MAGYSGTPLARKLGIQPNERFVALNAPTQYESLLEDLPADARLTSRLSSDARFVHLFVRQRSELARRLPKLRRKLDDAGVLWISWPKKSAKTASDLSENVFARWLCRSGWSTSKFVRWMRLGRG